MAWFVTYDLQQSENPEKSRQVRGAKRILDGGKLSRWQVGLFMSQSGARVYGVQIESEPGGTQLVEVPANAENVRVHEGEIPREYRAALDNAV